MVGVNIKSPNGWGWGSQVFDADTGVEIKGIGRIEITFEPDACVAARLEMLTNTVEVDGAVAEFWAVDPASGGAKQVRSITFEDGTSWEAASDAPEAEYEMLQFQPLNGPALKIKGAPRNGGDQRP